MKNYKHYLRKFLLFILCGILFQPPLFATAANIKISNNVSFESSNLPIIIINTFGQEIVDEPRIEAQMGIIFNGESQRNYLTDPWNDYNGRIAIELRGSSTARLQKKQYRLETQDQERENLNVSLIGMPKENDWILYGPYDDQSLIRNVLANQISNEIGRYASRTRFCELVLNDDYRGIYVLMEKIKRDNDRINISKMSDTDNEGDDVTGGYIYKMDKTSGENVGLWYSTLGNEYQYHYPNAHEITDQQKDYLHRFVDQFELIINNSTFTDELPEYESIIDVDSFVDHFLLNEFCKNVDAYRISAFMHKDRDSVDGHLIAGPIWDFNLSFGMAWFEEDKNVTKGWQVDYNEIRPADRWLVPFYWIKLSRDPYFANKIKQRWNELKTTTFSKQHIFSLIDEKYNLLKEAEIRNSARWPESAGSTTFIEKLDQIKVWAHYRYNWIDANIDKLAGSNTKVFNTNVEHTESVFNFPNPFNAVTNINFSVKAQNFVNLNIFNTNGGLVKVLVNETKSPGDYSQQFDASEFAGGIYFYELKIGEQKFIGKMVLTK